MLLLSSQLKKSGKAKNHICNPTDKNLYSNPNHITGCVCKINNNGTRKI